MDTPNKTPIYNLVILDKSGSMESIRTEAINGFNETLASIKATQDEFAQTQEHFISLAAFCNHGIDMIYNMTPINNAEKLTREKYNPCCLTPLFDAIGSTVNRLKRRISDKPEAVVLVTIITDGQENSSKEWSGQSVCKLIEERKEEGWSFSFIGAGEDVIKIATTISIKNTMLWKNTTEGTAVMFNAENKARRSFCCKMANSRSILESLEEKKEFLKQLSEEYYDNQN